MKKLMQTFLEYRINQIYIQLMKTNTDFLEYRIKSYLSYFLIYRCHFTNRLSYFMLKISLMFYVYYIFCLL